MKTIPLFWPHIPRRKILREISDTLKTRWIGQGPKVNEFEQEFVKKFKTPNALFLNSCTAALELAYHIIGIKRGDTVLTPVLTCTATNIPLARRHANIVFVDINTSTLNMDYEDFKRKLTGKVKAVVLVPLGGIEIDHKIIAYCRKRHIPVIIDAAQALGLYWPKADFVCYSFQAIKHMTTADGGVLVSKNPAHHSRAKLLRWFGIDREKKAAKDWQAWERREMTFNIEEAGYKFQPTDIDASFGLVGLREFDKIKTYREKLCKIYQKHLLANIRRVHGGANWLFGINVKHRDELAEYLKIHGIETNLVHLRNDIFQVFGSKRLDLTGMNWIENKYLYLPLNTKIKPSDVRHICRVVNNFYHNVKDPNI